LCLMIVGGTIYEQYQNREETVRIAGKLGSEPDILINMYKELIEEADPNMTVELKSNFGKTSFVFNALKSDEVDIYPEFTGTVLDSLMSVPESLDASQLSPEETYQEADKRLKEQFDMTLLKPMAYQNTYALAVRDDYAKDHQLTTISDLKAISQQVQAGFTLEFIDRDDGYKGIQSLYDLQFGDVASMEPSLRYEAIGNGDIDITDAYSTDSQLEEYHLKLLEDDQQLFASYQGAPLMRQEFYDDHPKIVEALNQLAGQITEEEMAKMNYAVNVEEKDAQEVAHDYLVAHGLVEEGD
ncbi:MAG: glycine/betaine ABC transporter permease, partial [Aerococcus suis]|nr:glycine/betaine ABC transporter permease [Aerococcus suis]